MSYRHHVLYLLRGRGLRFGGQVAAFFRGNFLRAFEFVVVFFRAAGVAQRARFRVFQVVAFFFLLLRTLDPGDVFTHETFIRGFHALEAAHGPPVDDVGGVHVVRGVQTLQVHQAWTGRSCAGSWNKFFGFRQPGGFFGLFLCG